MASDNPRSTAKVFGHPIHPMLVGYPIAFFTATFVSDIVYVLTRDGFWPTASLYLLIAGVVTALGAALAGFTDFFGDRRIRALSHAWQHMIGNLLVVLLSLANLLLRLGGAETAVLPLGLGLSALVTLLLVFTGWRGGDLVYRHRIGIPDEPGEVTR